MTHLCKHKADVGAAAMDDMGAIHFASQKGPLEVFRTLLSSGVPSKLPPERVSASLCEETHLFVEESGKTSKKGTLNGKDKAEVSEPKTSLEDKSEYSGGEATAGEHEEEVKESVKMKGEADDILCKLFIFTSFSCIESQNKVTNR
ncbi:ANKYRIN REPEAT PROTEIN [Salix purpurea]|uniref:ANKYRIN REPEAT PROTEIN n=1 Tax=Salix purpurea TaxID=77065 RepID=A0A9Q0TID6_SALPP|nr:ANKYRIN REPEAT PROTEIN [Salix purpurea]